MQDSSFTEGVRPGGLTTSREIRILLCYLIDNIKPPVTRRQIELALLEAQLANYFVLADSMAQLAEQGLATEEGGAFSLTSAGRTVAKTLGDELPRTVREAAVEGVLLMQHHATQAAAYQSEITSTGSGRMVACSITDISGPLFKLELYLPDDLSAEMAKTRFAQNGDDVYRLVLAGLTGRAELAKDALAAMDAPTDEE